MDRMICVDTDDAAGQAAQWTESIDLEHSQVAKLDVIGLTVIL